MKKMIEVLEEGRVPARREGSWEILGGDKNRSQGKNIF